jgi:glycosyltransferase involved in cell wall biosynthesis
LNILVITFIYPEGKNGERSCTGVFIEDEMAVLRSHGHAVTILVKGKKEFGMFREKGLMVYRIKAYGPIFSPFHMIKTLRSIEFDVVHAGFADFSGLYACIIGKLKRKPVVVSVQGFEVRNPKFRKRMGERFSPILAIITRFILRVCDAVVVHSFFLKKLIEQQGNPSKKIHVVYPVLRDTFISESEEMTINDSQIVLTVALLVPEKAIEHGIRAMKKVLVEVPKAKYVIVGDGPMKQQYLVLAHRLGIQDSICFTGHVPPHDVYKYYKESSIYLLTSITESFGISKIEANACGKPVVARDADAIPEGIIHGYNGFLFSDNSEIADYVIRLLRDKRLRLLMGENAKREAQKYSPEIFVHQMERIYRSLVGSVVH